MSELLTLAQTCARLDDPEQIVAAALPVLASVSGADATLALGSSVEGSGTGLHVTHRVGLALDIDASVVAGAPPQAGDVVDASVPEAWREAGVRRVAVRRLAGRSILLVLAWLEDDTHSDEALRLGLAVLDAELRRTTSAAAPLDPPAGMEEFERRHALEINDNVVQGLVAAAYALDQGQVAECSAFLNRTLASARAMMDGMLEPDSGHNFQPGDLVRSAPAHFGAHDAAPTREVVQAQGSHTVLVVDDADDLRMLLRSRMDGRRGLTVVGEAADGLAAVELASELQPDLVMLDLAMPRMDGLEALPLIRAAVPGVRVIVLSGFNQNTLAEKAMQAGADRYVIKGGSMRQLLDLVDTVLEDAS
ncbi:MAG: response regulator transcription factor [Marmoricola sp.]|nr:response regulator transcription factor [Marmoricola sp.]